MENPKLIGPWGVAAGVLAAVVILAATALWITTPAKAQQSPPCCPGVTIQWQPQSILETVVSARIIEDNKAILIGLQALAKNPGLTDREMMAYVQNTYLRTPRLWTREGWVEGWDNVMRLLRKIVTRDSRLVIDSVSALIVYQPYAGAKTPADDIDARVRVRMTFSASPGSNILEGELDHSRPCITDPPPPGTGPII